MPDELNYESHLLTFDQARQVFRRDGFLGMLIEYAIQNFVRTEQILAEWERRRAQDAEEQAGAQASAAQLMAVISALSGLLSTVSAAWWGSVSSWLCVISSCVGCWTSNADW